MTEIMKMYKSVKAPTAAYAMLIVESGLADLAMYFAPIHPPSPSWGTPKYTQLAVRARYEMATKKMPKIIKNLLRGFGEKRR